MAEDKKYYKLNVKLLRSLLIIADDLIHFVVALTLLVCATIVLFKAIPNLIHPDSESILLVLNDVLLVLIIMELLWPIVRFLQRKPFILNPFIYIGIISSTRRILLLEAKHSMISHAANGNSEWSTMWPVLAELGVNVVIILILAFALRLLSPKGQDSARLNE